MSWYPRETLTKQYTYFTMFKVHGQNHKECCQHIQIVPKTKKNDYEKLNDHQWELWLTFTFNTINVPINVTAWRAECFVWSVRCNTMRSKRFNYALWEAPENLDLNYWEKEYKTPIHSDTGNSLWSRVHIVYDGAILYSRSTSWRWQFLSKNLENFQENLYQIFFLDFSRLGLSIKNWKFDFLPPPPPPVKGFLDFSRFGLSIKSWKLAVMHPSPPP